MTEIERAIESFKAYLDDEDGFYVLEHDAINQAIVALREKQERENPRPLTLEDGFEITNADGTPIDYEALGLEYKNQLCYCDIDGFYLGQDGNLILVDDCGKSVWVDRGDYHIEARKPKEE